MGGGRWALAWPLKCGGPRGWVHRSLLPLEQLIASSSPLTALKIAKRRPKFAFSALFGVHFALLPSPSSSLLRPERNGCVHRPIAAESGRPRHHRARSEVARRARRTWPQRAYIGVLRRKYLWRSPDARQAAARHLRQAPRRRASWEETQRRRCAACRAGNQGMGAVERRHALHALVSAANRPDRREARRVSVVR